MQSSMHVVRNNKLDPTAIKSKTYRTMGKVLSGNGTRNCVTCAKPFLFLQNYKIKSNQMLETMVVDECLSLSWWSSEAQHFHIYIYISVVKK